LSIHIQELSVAVTKTGLGAQVMKDRSVSLSAQQRSALILCDGKRSAEDVVRMTSAVGVTLQDLEALANMGLVQMDAVVALPVVAPAAPSAEPLPNTSAKQTAPGNTDFHAALNTAITLCASLGFKGFGLNMALADVDSMEKLQKIAPDIRRVAGDSKYKPLHALIFGKPL
jgi:hypothetical protein